MMEKGRDVLRRLIIGGMSIKHLGCCNKFELCHQRPERRGRAGRRAEGMGGSSRVHRRARLRAQKGSTRKKRSQQNKLLYKQNPKMDNDNSNRGEGPEGIRQNIGIEAQ